MLVLEKSAFVKAAAFWVEHAPAKPKPVLVATNVPSTTALDRQHLQAPKSTATGSIRLVALEGTHKKKTFALALAAITRAPAEQRPALLESIRALERESCGAITLLSLLANRFAAKLRVADVEALPLPSAYDAAAFIERLELWRGHRAAAEAIIGLPEPVQSMLADAFRSPGDKETQRLAAEYIAGTRKKRGGWSVVGFLKAMGSPEGADALEQLARRRRAQLHRETHPRGLLPDALLDHARVVHALVDRMRDAKKDEREDTLRGTIGELLRIEQLSADPKYSDKLILRGVHIFDASGEERTEIDVAIFEEQGGKLTPLMFENVKAGLDHGTEARHQNKVAKAALLDGNARFEYPRGTEITSKIDRTVVPTTRTVGPADDRDYDVALPATASDLIQVVARLLP